jgi:hypothetical protein
VFQNGSRRVQGRKRVPLLGALVSMSATHEQYAMNAARAYGCAKNRK